MHHHLQLPQPNTIMSVVNTIYSTLDKLEEHKALVILGNTRPDASQDMSYPAYQYARSLSLSTNGSDRRRQASPQRSSSSMSSSSRSSSMAESIFSSTSSRDSSCCEPNRYGPDAGRHPHIPDFAPKMNSPSAGLPRREPRSHFNSLGRMHHDRPLTDAALKEGCEDDDTCVDSHVRSDGMSGSRLPCETVIENSTKQRHHGRNPLRNPGVSRD
ncbi:hypothetical protein B0I35DRAFT_69227 [Stachybotrys elegans]|uniref:Uncharacterized protein n=1 Tax=Stachybotrys elegans TaxID=80388 RepID=A0A8K0WPA8_9HYPO|nr:hypothetical protein B0I35DRAFT_69227 [Stachybotrys elegans]